MHIEYPITLVDYEGNVFLIDHDDAVRLARDVNYGNIILKGTPLEDRIFFRGPNLDGSNVYSARDFYGQVVTNTTWPVKLTLYRGRRNKAVVRAIELGIPVPNTGCYKKGRHASNKARFREVRQQAGHEEQIKAIGANDNNAMRKRENPGWDRCYRHCERNWKSQRRTQWKA